MDLAVWWSCENGHEWKRAICNAVKRNNCPVCTGRAASRENSLSELNPQLACEWDHKKNKGLQPWEVTPFMSYNAHWICEKGHTWRAPIHLRNKGLNNCPYCNGSKLHNDTCLATVNPALAMQWHPVKNKDRTPWQVRAKSAEKAWWICENNHEWEAVIYTRNKGVGCPYCAGKAAVWGENDLATLHPDLAGQWHATKNKGLKPWQVKAHSHEKVWWTCSLGHSWRTTPDHRVRGQGCPYCSGRRVAAGFNDLATVNPALAAQWHPAKNGDLTPEKVTAFSNKRVWWRCGDNHEWDAKINVRSRGFGCPYCSGRLPVKGSTDLAARSPELAAQWHPTKNGGLAPWEVLPQSDRLVWWQCEKQHEWQAKVGERYRGNGCPYCSGRRVIAGETDLAARLPALAAQWHSTKNGELTPAHVSIGSGKQVWWQCEKQHEWQAAVAYRAKGHGCPYCAGKRAWKGFNDLATANPVLAGQWHPHKNGPLGPVDVTAGSGKKVWWICGEGHEWEASIASRAKGNGCPVCAGRKLLTGYNDLLTKHPALAAWWDTPKNGIGPSAVLASSSKPAWWRCGQGHSWQAPVSSRGKTLQCPLCKAE